MTANREIPVVGRSVPSGGLGGRQFAEILPSVSQHPKESPNAHH
jgi:hypothetical protein